MGPVTDRCPFTRRELEQIRHHLPDVHAGPVRAEDLAPDLPPELRIAVPLLKLSPSYREARAFRPLDHAAMAVEPRMTPGDNIRRAST